MPLQALVCVDDGVHIRTLAAAVPGPSVVVVPASSIDTALVVGP